MQSFSVILKKTLFQSFMLEKHGEFLLGVRNCVPTLLGYWAIGIATGLVATGSGLSLGQAFAASALLYAGSAQLLLYSVVGAGGDLTAAVFGICFVNLRYVLTSLYLATTLKQFSVSEKALACALTTDETFGLIVLGAQQKSSVSPKWISGINVTAYVNWVLANATGASLGTLASQRFSSPLRFSLVSMFIALAILSIPKSSSQLVKWLVVAGSSAISAILFFCIGENGGALVGSIIAACLCVPISKRQSCRA